MSTTNDGGPAFPAPDAGGDDFGQNSRGVYRGMTLRDYFAAKAMHGFITEPVDGVQEAMFYELADTVCDDIAKSAYQMADAMLKARAL